MAMAGQRRWTGDTLSAERVNPCGLSLTAHGRGYASPAAYARVAAIQYGSVVPGGRKGVVIFFSGVMSPNPSSTVTVYCIKIIIH